MEFYNPEIASGENSKMTNQEVEDIFHKYFSQRQNEKAEQKEEKKDKETEQKPVFWTILWSFLICIIEALFFVIKRPVTVLAEMLGDKIKSKIIRYAVAILGYATLILIIIL